MTPEQIAQANQDDIHRLNRLASLEAQMDPPPAEYRGIIRYWPTWVDVLGLLDAKEWELNRVNKYG